MNNPTAEASCCPAGPATQPGFIQDPPEPLYSQHPGCVWHASTSPANYILLSLCFIFENIHEAATKCGEEWYSVPSLQAKEAGLGPQRDFCETQWHGSNAFLSMSMTV